ncbi:antibiotic resistance protein VanZ [Domibacillus aminovorans]|uniref:Antibiotic resistance protein VanZ n=1 Tax=Domibacillus aminovorans TaxID=29332 RepID=A0A177KPM7_9BACI|nr:antibiotic resistance protein VanZ [Domibacillus aminovorans]
MGILLLIGAVIFHFSSQTYDQQSLVPLLRRVLPGEPFAGVLSHVQVSYWDSIISVETKGYYYFVEFLIRKFAHLFLFGCLAMALFSVMMLARPRHIWPVVLFSLMGTGIYAVLDEYHQFLTGGRTPLLKDVVLDLMGATAALSLYVPLFLWRMKRK